MHCLLDSFRNLQVDSLIDQLLLLGGRGLEVVGEHGADRLRRVVQGVAHQRPRSSYILSNANNQE